MERDITEDVRTPPPKKKQPKGPAPAAGAAPTPGGFPCSDLGNAERLAHRHGAELRYCPTWKRWLVWDGRRWRQDDTGEIVRRAGATVRGIVNEAAGAERESWKALLKWAATSESAARIKAMISLCESLPGIPVMHSDLDRNPWLLNVENGTLDLRVGELRPHDRADLITKLAPVAYDPAAECRRWLALVDRAMGGRADLVAFLQRAVGYSLTGSVREQCLFLFHGGGANGKSTIVESLLALLGDYATAGAPNLLMERPGDPHPTEVADLCGARMVHCPETQKGRRWDEALLKKLTGGDTLKARRMCQDFWGFEPTHKLFVSANHRPRVSGTDHGIWRRIKLVPFLVTIPEHEQDRDLLVKLRAEWPGILRWAVQGCLDWQRYGLGLPEEVRDATAAYRQEQDILGDFLAARCVLDPQIKIARQELRKAYESWCEETGERPHSARTLAAELKERGITDGGTVRHLGKIVDAWKGIRLKTEEERERVGCKDE